MSRHPLEEKWNTSAWDILSAIEQGFRAQVDVKGKLAEFHLHRHIEALRARGTIQSVEWQDADGKPDFLVGVGDRVLRVECKNVRSPRARQRTVPPAARGELQKTRNAKDGTPGRGYKTEEFDLLAACLFNVTGRWDYLYVATRSLARRPDDPDKPFRMSDYLVIMQPVPLEPHGAWRGDFLMAVEDALSTGDKQ